MKKLISIFITVTVLLCLTVGAMAPNIMAAEVKLPKSFQDFETYKNNDELNNYGGGMSNYKGGYYENPAGGKATFELDTVNKFSGKYGLKFTYNVGGEGGKEDYCGRETFMPVITTDDLAFQDDWTGGQMIQFWLKGDTSNNSLVIQFETDDGEVWRKAFLLNSDKPQIVRIRLREMEARYDSTSMRLDHINKTCIYVNKNLNGNKGTKDTGTIYLDDFQIVRSTDPVPEIKEDLVASTPTNTITSSDTTVSSENTVTSDESVSDTQNYEISDIDGEISSEQETNQELQKDSDDSNAYILIIIGVAAAFVIVIVIIVCVVVAKGKKNKKDDA